jgi:superfamily II DNA or RNA helicase
VIVLRPHQERAVGEVRAAFRRAKRVVMVAPTGFGKTAVASTIIAWAVQKGRRVLFLVHRREIVEDTHRRLVAAGVDCGLVMAGAPSSPLLKVQVASVQTVAARQEHPPADLIVWDECHHVAAMTYREIARQYPDAWHLGLTATPERSDGQGLRDAFDEMVVGATVAELQTAVDPATGAPYLAACDVIAPARRLESGVLSADPVEAWHAHAKGRPTVAFCRTVAESKALAAGFEEEGVTARHIDGTTPADERKASLDAFARGNVQVLCNVFVLTEGWDCPRAKCVLLARGCGSAATFLQMVGRGLRAHNGERCLLLDLAGCVHEHGLPEEEREFTLDGIRRKAKKARPWIRQCQVCGFTVLGAKSGRVCERCGTPWPAAAATAVSKKEALAPVDVAAVTPRVELRARYLKLVDEAMRKGYKPSWAGHRFREEFGFWPRGLVA